MNEPTGTRQDGSLHLWAQGCGSQRAHQLIGKSEVYKIETQIGQRSVVFFIAKRRIGVSNEQHVVVELMRVTRGRLAATIGQRAGNDQGLDTPSL